MFLRLLTNAHMKFWSLVVMIQRRIGCHSDLGHNLKGKIIYIQNTSESFVDKSERTWSALLKHKTSKSLNSTEILLNSMVLIYSQIWLTEDFVYMSLILSYETLYLCTTWNDLYQIRSQLAIYWKSVFLTGNHVPISHFYV